MLETNCGILRASEVVNECHKDVYCPHRLKIKKTYFPFVYNVMFYSFLNHVLRVKVNIMNTVSLNCRRFYGSMLSGLEER